MEDLEESSSNLSWSEAESGEAKIRRVSVDSIHLGCQVFNRKRELAKLVLNYLEHVTHTILFMHGGYPFYYFQAVRYGSLFLQRCIEHEVVEYINRCNISVFRWLTFSKVKNFSVMLVGEDGAIVADYIIKLYRMSSSGHKQIENFEKQAAELRGLFERSLLQIQCQSNESSKSSNRRRLFLRVALCSGSNVHRKRSLEYKWQNWNEQTYSKFVKPCSVVVNSALIKVLIMRADLQGKKCNVLF